MATEIWPTGEIELSDAVIDGKRYVRLHFLDPDGAETILGFGLEHFVHLTDAWQGWASALLDEERDDGRGPGWR